MAKLRMAHASMHGARKPPGPKILSVDQIKLKKLGDRNSDSRVYKDLSRQDADLTQLEGFLLVKRPKFIN